MFDEIIYDLETQKLFEEINGNNITDLGISVICLYKRRLNQNYQEQYGQMYTFWVNEIENMWPLFSNVTRVIGFNSLEFDNQLLKPLCQKFDFSKLNHLDIMAEAKKVIGHRISLNAIAKETLGLKKTDIGTNAVLYWKKGDQKSLETLKNYCQSDVEITKKIYDFALKNKFLKFKDKWNTVKSFSINFSYTTNQFSLF